MILLLKWLCLAALLTRALPATTKLAEEIHTATHSFACSAGGEPVVLSIWDSHLLLLLAEWYGRLQEANGTQTVVLAMDDPTMVRCQSLGATCIHAQGVAGAIYASVWALLDAGCDVLFSSPSVYWFKDPQPYFGTPAPHLPLLPPVFFNQHSDKVLDFEIAGYALHPAVNSNFFLARSNERTACFFSQLHQRISESSSVPAGTIVDAMLPNVHVLDSIAPSDCNLRWGKLSVDQFVAEDGSHSSNNAVVTMEAPTKQMLKSLYQQGLAADDDPPFLLAADDESALPNKSSLGGKPSRPTANIATMQAVLVPSTPLPLGSTFTVFLVVSHAALSNAALGGSLRHKSHSGARWRLCAARIDGATQHWCTNVKDTHRFRALAAGSISVGPLLFVNFPAGAHVYELTLQQMRPTAWVQQGARTHQAWTGSRGARADEITLHQASITFTVEEPAPAEAIRFVLLKVLQVGSRPASIKRAVQEYCDIQGYSGQDRNWIHSTSLMCEKLVQHVVAIAAQRRPVSGNGAGGRREQYLALVPVIVDSGWRSIVLVRSSDGCASHDASAQVRALCEELVSMGLMQEMQQCMASLTDVAQQALAALVQQRCAFVLPIMASIDGEIVTEWVQLARAASTRLVQRQSVAYCGARAGSSRECVTKVSGLLVEGLAGWAEVQHHCGRFVLNCSSAWRAEVQAKSSGEATLPPFGLAALTAERVEQQHGVVLRIDGGGVPSAGPFQQYAIGNDTVGHGQGQDKVPVTRPGVTHEAVRDEVGVVNGLCANPADCCTAGDCCVVHDVCILKEGHSGKMSLRPSDENGFNTLKRVLDKAALLPMFNAGEGSGSTYTVNQFQVPRLLRPKERDSRPQDYNSHDYVPILFWPLYHPNFGHFVADFLPLLVKQAALFQTFNTVQFVLPFGEEQMREMGLAKHLQLLQAFSKGVPVSSLDQLAGQCFSKIATCSFLKEDGLSSGYLAHADRKPVVVPSRFYGALEATATGGSPIPTRKVGRDLLDGVQAVNDWFATTDKGLNNKHNFNVVIVKRPQKRRILNTQRLLKICQELLQEKGLAGQCQEVDFAELSVEAMLALMQQTSVLVGMFGAGLVNALFAMKPPKPSMPKAQPSCVDEDGGGNIGRSVRERGIGVLEVLPYRLQECAWSQW
jgi:hypothetical protein